MDSATLVIIGYSIGWFIGVILSALLMNIVYYYYDKNIDESMKRMENEK